MLQGSIAVDSRLAKLHPQIKRTDFAIIKRLRDAKLYDSWNVLFIDFLKELGTPVPPELEGIV